MEDLLLTFQAFITPVLSLNAPLWFPIRSKLKAPVARLQAVQNYALRMVTGCHATTSVEHLLEECQILPVYDHLAMQCTQFLANAMQTDHPSHKIVTRLPGARPNIKPTLQHCFGDRTLRFLHNGAIPAVSYKRAIKAIHTETVAAVHAR